MKMQNKLFLILSLLLVLFSIFVIAEISPPLHPFTIGIKLNSNKINVSDLKVCIKNLNTNDERCGSTNKEGEWIDNAANFPKGYSYGDLIKIGYCIETTRCKENNIIEQLKESKGNVVLEKDLDKEENRENISQENVEKIPKEPENKQIKNETTINIIINKVIENKFYNFTFKVVLLVITLKLVFKIRIVKRLWKKIKKWLYLIL